MRGGERFSPAIETRPGPAERTLRIHRNVVSRYDLALGESHIGGERGGAAGSTVPGTRESSSGDVVTAWRGTNGSGGQPRTGVPIHRSTNRSAVSALHRKKRHGYFRAATEAYPNGLMSVRSSDAGSPPGLISRLVGATDAVTCVRHPSVCTL